MRFYLLGSPCPSGGFKIKQWFYCGQNLRTWASCLGSQTWRGRAMPAEPCREAVLWSTQDGAL